MRKFLNNFCESRINFCDKQNSEVVKTMFNIELFSILTFKDLIWYKDKRKPYYLYYNSSLPYLDAMNQTSVIFQHNAYLSMDGFINECDSLKKASESSLNYTEKLLITDEEIKQLKNYRIGNVMLSDNSFKLIMNLNSKNILSLLMIIIENIITYCKKLSKQEVIDLINNFLNIREKSLYYQKNVNNYVPRYVPTELNIININYIKHANNIIRKEINDCIGLEIQSRNPNPLLCMYWDTLFLYPIIKSIFGETNKSNIKDFVLPEDFSFRYFRVTKKNQDLFLTRIDDFYLNYDCHDDSLNNLNIEDPIVSYNNRSLRNLLYCLGENK